MSAISGEFTHFRHIKTRKIVILEIETPEEQFQHIISILGMPIGGESKPVAVALLNPTIKESLTVEQSANNAHCNCHNLSQTDVHMLGCIYSSQTNLYSNKLEQTEGEKLRVRAVMLCKDPVFAKFITDDNLSSIDGVNEIAATRQLKTYCDIESRAEITSKGRAQEKLKELITKFESWKLEQQYPDNLNRI